MIKTFLLFVPNAYDIPLKNGLHVQVLQNIEDLPKARKAQFAAVIATKGLLVVWDDDPSNLLIRAKHIENELMELAWDEDMVGDAPPEITEKKAPKVVVLKVDEESGEALPEERPLHLMNSIYVGIVLFIIIVLLGTGIRQIAFEVKADNNYTRLALLALIPVNVFFTLVSVKAVANLRNTLLT